MLADKVFSVFAKVWFAFFLVIMLLTVASDDSGRSTKKIIAEEFLDCSLGATVGCSVFLFCVGSMMEDEEIRNPPQDNRSMRRPYFELV